MKELSIQDILNLHDVADYVTIGDICFNKGDMVQIISEPNELWQIIEFGKNVFNDDINVELYSNGYSTYVDISEIQKCNIQ